jgi:hypothetical protein
MKKTLLLVLIIVGAILGLVLYSFAREKFNLPRPEDKAGKEASAFMPIESEGKPTTKGSGQLKLTGPVWVNE